MSGGGDHLRCSCPHCGGAIEFPAEGAGAGIECPHCGEAMNLVTESEEVGRDGWEETAPGPGRPQISELAAAFTGKVSRRRPTVGYRLAMWAGAGALVLMLAAYAGLVVALGWFLVASVDDWMRWARAGSGGALAAGGRTALFLGGLGMGALILGFLLRPFFVKPPRPAQPLALNPASEPLLFAFLHMVCEAVGAPRPARVEVDCRLNASVGFRRGTWRLGAEDWVMTLGMPLVAGLSLRQFAGVLAHELAHFNQGWGLRASHGVRGLNEWLECAAGRQASPDALLERWSGGAGGGLSRWVAEMLRIGVGLSQIVLRAVLFAGQMVSRNLRRQMERDADRVQIELAGSETFETTFRRLCVLGEVRRDVYRELRARWTAGKPLPADLPESLLRAAEGVPEEKRERWCERRLAREPDFLDAHPSDRARIEWARERAAPGVFRHDGDARMVFSNFGELARQVTAIHYSEDLRIASGDSTGVERTPTDAEN